MKVDPSVEKAFEMAKKARENASAQYSDVKVGAAIKIKGSDKIYNGCNVEHVVMGISICAERNAIGTAMTDTGNFEIEFVVVCSHTDPALYPCGVCLQAMSDFCDPEMDIYVASREKILEKVKFKDVLTHQYAHLPKVLTE